MWNPKSNAKGRFSVTILEGDFLLQDGDLSAVGLEP